MREKAFAVGLVLLVLWLLKRQPQAATRVVGRLFIGVDNKTGAPQFRSTDPTWRGIPPGFIPSLVLPGVGPTCPIGYGLVQDTLDGSYYCRPVGIPT